MMSSAAVAKLVAARAAAPARSARSAARIRVAMAWARILRGIGIVGKGVQGVQVVPGDDVGDLFAVAWEGLAQVGGDGEVAGFPVPAGQRVVGDLA